MRLVPKTARYLQSFLLGLSAILAVYLLVALNRDYVLQGDADEPAASVGIAETTANQPSDLPPIEEFAAIVERPLFMMDRKPYVPGIAETEQPQTPVNQNSLSNEQYLLSAIIISEDKRLALLTKQSDSKLYKLGVGESIDGWTIQDIQTREVSLNRGTESRKLELMVNTSPVAATPQVRQRRMLRQATAMQPAPTDQTEMEAQTAEPNPPVRAVRRIPGTTQEFSRQPTPEEIETLEQRNLASPSPPAVAQ
jgi:hypothetical protein